MHLKTCSVNKVVPGFDNCDDDFYILCICLNILLFSTLGSYDRFRTPKVEPFTAASTHQLIMKSKEIIWKGLIFKYWKLMAQMFLYRERILIFMNVESTLLSVLLLG